MQTDTIAVLVPAYNEELLIARTIQSALRNGVEPQDVWVIDDGSTDKTAEIALHQGVVVLGKPNGGKASAIAEGLDHINACGYQWVAILDADSEMDDGYLQSMKEAIFRYPNASLLCGGPRSRQSNWITAYRAVEYAVCLGIYRPAQDMLGVINVAPGCASVYRVSDLCRCCFYHDTLVEDMDLTIQLQRAGKEIRYVSSATVTTQDPRSLRDYIGQISRWYRGLWQVIRLHRLGRHTQKIDIEVAAMAAEGLWFAGKLALTPWLIYAHPRIVLAVWLAGQVKFLLYTLVVAWRQKRADVVWAFPRYWILQTLNGLVFLYTFLSERRTGKKTSWFSVKRYA